MLFLQAICMPGNCLDKSLWFTWQRFQKQLAGFSSLGLRELLAQDHPAGFLLETALTLSLSLRWAHFMSLEDFKFNPHIFPNPCCPTVAIIKKPVHLFKLNCKKYKFLGETK